MKTKVTAPQRLRVILYGCIVGVFLGMMMFGFVVAGDLLTDEPLPITIKKLPVTTPEPEVVEPVMPVEPAIHIKEPRGEAPTFKRIYSAQINDEVRIEVERWSGYGGRYDISTLTQSDGRWVLFEVEKPADKILDREIIHIVERYCAEIIRLDKEYIASRPAEFTDQTGQVWRRVSKDKP